MATTEITTVQTKEQYQAERSVIFPSLESLRWFMRRNRSELVEAGAVVRPTGEILIVPQRFDAVVDAIGQSRAREVL